MSPEAKRILDQAKRLTETERAEIATELFDTIEKPFRDEVDRAWREEIVRRIEAMDRGDVKGIPWAEVRRRMVGGQDDSAVA